MVREKTTQLLALNGLFWPVSISEDEMQIGCQIHAHKFWDNCSDESIGKMDDNALKFWGENKELLLMLCAKKAGAKS